MSPLTSLRRHNWLLSALAVFVVQNHCGAPGIPHDQLAVHLLERGQFERAVREGLRAVRENPDDVDARVITALAEAGLGRLDRSVEGLSEALRRHPDDPRLYVALRSLCGEQGCAGLALQALEEMRQARPDNWYVGANLGWAHALTGDREAALSLLEEAVAAISGQIDEAEQIFAHQQLSRLYLDTGRYDDAARILEGALILRPQDPRLLISIGECRLRQGDEEDARPWFDRALEATDDAVETASLIAQVHYSAGLPRQAIHYYELAARQRDVTPLILNNLAWTYAEEDLELERAADLSLRALKADIDNVVYLDTYAEVLFRRGRTDQAIALMRHAIELEPEDGEHYDYLRGQLTRFQAARTSPAGTDSLL